MIPDNVNSMLTYFFSYSSKRRQDRYLEFDPRPASSLTAATSSTAKSEAFLRDLQELPGHKPTMWGKILVFNYEDYEITPEREANLHRQVGVLLDNLRVI